MHTVREAISCDVSGGHMVVMDLSHLDHKHVDLLFSWIEIWLHRHCKAGWHITFSDETEHVKSPHHYLKVDFQDAREAMYFKLSPEFGQNYQPADRRFREWLAAQGFLLQST